MSVLEDSDDWTNQEFGAASLGDARLTRRLVALARRLAKSPQCSFPQSLDWAQLKAAYRFFNHPRIDTEGILGGHIGQTLKRMQQVPVVLVAQDTTEFNLMHLPATQGLGYGTSSNLHGFMLHSLLAVTPEGLPLGVLGMKTWTRAPEESGKSSRRKKRPIEEKESVKWLEGLEQLAWMKTHCPDTNIIGISDRDGDVYDAFIAPRPAGVDWLVRAAWNRRVAHAQTYLWEAVAAEPAVGETNLLVPSRDAKTPSRTAKLTVRCKALWLHPPRSRQREKLPDVEVFVIHALETQPPDGVEPIEWMLLSSVPTLTCNDALERLAWYARRWTIESWHRVLKSGCQIEARQFGHLDRFVRATALFAVISWRILYATLLARLDGELSCEILLQPIEWQALYCRIHGTTQVPTQVPTLAQVVLWVAKLGGYLNRKHEHPPGPTVMWRGFLALHESTVMYRIFRQNK